ncbi:Uncharacterised protein [uncultured archaeon]|nr:Uncharacterised protein [uncultured archaeon]
MAEILCETISGAVKFRDELGMCWKPLIGELVSKNPRYLAELAEDYARAGRGGGEQICIEMTLAMEVSANMGASLQFKNLFESGHFEKLPENIGHRAREQYAKADRVSIMLAREGKLPLNSIGFNGMGRRRIAYGREIREKNTGRQF